MVTQPGLICILPRGTAMKLKGTTILAVKTPGMVTMGGDGQVTMGQSIVMKHTARKVRTLYKKKVLAGFAGATADAFTLFERFEAKLEEANGNLLKASVEMAKDWRKDKYLHRLEAMIIVADPATLLVLSGNGDVIEPDDGIAAIGSGGPYALAAARALSRNLPDVKSDFIVREAMKIAGELCIFTNDRLIIETLEEEHAARS